MRFVKPLDETLIVEMADAHSLLVTIEEHVVAGGAGSAVSEVLRRHNRSVEVLTLGLPDAHIGHGTQREQLADCGLDADAIKGRILRAITTSTTGAKGGAHRPVKAVKS